jgi:hypothetical protein
MEKPGMDRRRKSSGARLLKPRPFLFPGGLLVLGLGFLCPLPAQAPPPRILVESAPGRLRSGGTWTLTILVDHPRPGEVEVLPPPFPPALSPGLVRQEPRIIGTERWTAVEYHFGLRGSGRVILGPFEIISPQGRALSSPLELDIEAPEGEPLLFRLAWENIPPRLSPGESAEFSLRLLEGDLGRLPPASGVLLPEAPEGFILERLRPEPGDREAGRALRLRLLALSGTPFRLPARSLRFGNLLLEIPPLLIPVSGSGAPPGGPPPPEEISPAPPAPFPPPPPGPAPFPDMAALVPDPPLPFLHSAYQRALAPVQVLWDAGDRVRALAELRGRERSHFAGPLLRPLRRSLETSLGLKGVPDEAWRPRLLFRIGLLGVLGLAALIIAPRRLFHRGKGGKTPPARRIGRVAGLALLLALGGFSLWGLLDSRGFPGGRRSGVVRETAARRVPGLAGTITALFREGQPVRAWPLSGSWVRVEIPDSPLEDGWIPAGDIVFYSY